MNTYNTLEAIRAASNADLHAWIEWNDSNADFDGMEDETEILRATVAHMCDLYETIEDALRGEGWKMHQLIEGFEIFETGGGCTAQSRVFPNGAEILVTQSDTADWRASERDYTVGVYAHDHCCEADKYWSSDDSDETLSQALMRAINHVRSLSTNI